MLRKLEAKELPAGINRVKWDLRYDAPRVVALRTVAPDNPHIWAEPRFRLANSRPITHWGSKPGEAGPIVAPGQYTVRLTVDGKSYTQPLTILADPRSPGSEADIQLSVKTLLKIRDDISHVSDSVNQIEWLRKQLETIEAMLRPAKPSEKREAPLAEEEDERESEPARAPPRQFNETEERERGELLTAAEALDKKLDGIESRLVSPALRNSDDKYFVQAYGVYLDLIWLNAEVGTGGGDVAGSADFAPTVAQLDSLKTLETQMTQVDSDFNNLMEHELPAFNQALDRTHHLQLTGSAAGHQP
ncbi:MAG: hypothetical protein JO042_01565 [Sinobacteraceae bacterium]|nr:hypothetical protein [Nevskiaceae bacterium]